LLAALSRARNFVHLVSWGLSWDFIGMLALLSHRVPVRGVISGCDENKARQIREAATYGGDHFDVRPLCPRDSSSSPHQKIIIIDGLLALWGSANLTIQGWRQVDLGHEQIVVETRPEEVCELNNRYFSPIWSKLHPVPDNVAPMRRRGRRWAESLR
jgi:PLD-like domain